MNKNVTLSLYAARVNAGLSRTFVADTLGVSVGTLGEYERGEIEPGAIVFVQMCKLYGVPCEIIRFEDRLIKRREEKKMRKGDQ